MATVVIYSRRFRPRSAPERGGLSSLPIAKHLQAWSCLAGGDLTRQPHTAIDTHELSQLRAELNDALERERATAQVLKAISRSSVDLHGVLQNIVEAAARLCGAEKATLFGPSGGAYRLAASFGLTPEHEEYLRNTAITPGRETITGAPFWNERPYMSKISWLTPNTRSR